MDVKVDSAVVQSQGVQLLAVFGSRARRVERPSSDLDVAALLGPGVSASLELRDAVTGAIKTSAPLGLVVLNSGDPLLLREVALDGYPVYEDRPGRWEEFRILAFKRYYDTAWIRELEGAAARSRAGREDGIGSTRRRPA